MSYVKGIKLYEAIVESKILETTQNQIKILTTQADKIIKESTAVVRPKEQVPLNTAPLNPVPLNTAPLNPVPLNPAPVQALLNPIIPAPVENNNFTQPLSEETNIYNENKDAQINPQQNNFNAPKPVN